MFVLCSFLSFLNAQTPLPKIFLHPKTIARESQTKFVDSLHFIPLEIKKGIEPGNNYNITITEKYILLLDYSNKKMFAYLKDGKFVKEVSFKKLGQGFYPNYDELSNQVSFFGNNKNYSLTPKDMVQVKMDWNNPRNKKYFKKFVIDLNDPSFTIKKGSPDEMDIVQIRHLYGDYYVQGQINVSQLYKDSIDHELKLYKNNQFVKGYFPYNHHNEPRFLYVQENVSLNKTDTDQVHIITRPFSDTIYKMVGDSLFAAYKLVLPLENTLPASFYNKPFKNKTERDNFYRNNGWMMRQIYSFYETPRFMFFTVGYLSNFDSYIVEKQTAITYKTKNIKADSSQYNLQLFANTSFIRKGTQVYKAQKAGELLAFFSQNKDVPVPKELDAFLKSNPPADSPVIVAFKLKN